MWRVGAQVQMGIDESRHDQHAASVDALIRIAVEVRSNVDDALVFEHQHAIAPQHMAAPIKANNPAALDQCAHSAKLPLPKFCSLRLRSCEEVALRGGCTPARRTYHSVEDALARGGTTPWLSAVPPAGSSPWLLALPPRRFALPGDWHSHARTFHSVEVALPPPMPKRSNHLQVIAIRQLREWCRWECLIPVR